MARSVDQIIGELNSVYQPQIDNINKQVAELPAYYQAQTAGVNQAKENAFRDITGAASSRGMLYSGMPIAEQTRYTGEKYLPALAQLKQQENQQRFGFQTQLTDIYGKRMAQAQAIQQQELDREMQAQLERERIAAQERAARAAAARSYGGGGGRSGGGGGGSRMPSVDDAAALVNSLRSSGKYGDSGYGAIAEAMRQRGYDISRDSVFDRGLRKAFGFGWQ